ncbi:sugar-binding domain-containing protein [Mesorhizobium sp.]|uniref:sugar-binding transcriptional regulator n=1 Tax=Mesorhizobium sp. TaxID=1871066 RepID=UPI000FE74F09|nr:sugar-binding domain-containing protein [Mesorhizobium sp.]RWO91374.1 MAG: winged helix-turn-helix transcriptional regulator [Mesorhizobium sp.]RWQ51189.1 MAG: winged helix-turn-helix transcriptional regulator [Mesorhizobium sp.]TIM09372.1 MAG: winged helix-turn-helix transcriptional regulator [Mesorhizobium sp.]
MLHTVAKLHYEADMSQVDIARQLGVSTATISRLLQRARAEGIVRIEVLDLATPEGITTQLVEALGLRDAAVIETPAAGALTALAAPLGAVLKQAGLTAGKVVAIGWGRAIRQVIQAGLPRIPGVLTVAATGGMQQQAAHFQINEFVRLAAEELGGTPHFIHAPYLPSSELREVFLGDAAIRDSVALWDRTDVAIVGIGLPHAINPPEASAATLSEQALFHAAGDVIRHYFDAEGTLIPWEGEGRMIAMSPAQLRAVPLVIGVAASPEKAKAIIGAVRARLINALVTDTKTAQAILEALLPR